MGIELMTKLKQADELPVMQTADHDLLIEVSTNVKNLTTTLHSYNTANLAVTQDHEGRIRSLEEDNRDYKGQLKGSRRMTNILMSVIGLMASAALAVAALGRHP